MGLTIFSGNKTVTGGAMFVTFQSKDQAVYLKIVKQTEWNEKTAKPSFTGGAVVNIKLSMDEVGDYIHAVAGHTARKFYHEFNKEVTSGNFSYWSKDFTDKAGKPAKSEGFGLSIKKGEIQAKIGFSLGAAEKFSQYLQFALNHMFSAIYAQDKKEQEEYMKKRDGEKTASALVSKKPAAVVNKEVPPDVDPIPDPSTPELVTEGSDESMEW